MAVTVQPSGKPPSYSACHATRSRLPVPLTLSDSDERLKAAPDPSVAEFASPANAGGAPPPVGGKGAGVGDGEGAGVGDGAGAGVGDGAGAGVDGAGVGVDGSGVGLDGAGVVPAPVDGGEGADAGALSVLQAIAVSSSASATKRVGPFMTLDTQLFLPPRSAR